MAHYDIFRHQLLITAPAYGYALWDPDPGNLYPAVEVGDVGYIREGKFHRLFNVLLPAEHPSHENGVPDYHEQLNIKNHINKGTLSAHNFCSTSVTSPESDLQANGPKQEGEVSFLCRMNQGAVLCLPIKAKKEDTVAIKRFGKCMIKHIDTWFAWAQQLELGVDRMEDIILVTGTHRTRSYTNVAFPGGREDAQASFRANLKVDHPDGITINWQLSHEHIRGAHLNPGPDGKDLPEDQCIFIRGFRVIRKYKIFPRLKGAAGPNPDPEEYDEEPDMELVPVPAVPEYRDPLHILLEFIAEEALNCDMALVHDNDLAELHGIYDGTPIESLQPDAMLRYFRSAELKIHEIHPLSVDNGGNTDAEAVCVATLSNLFEELSPSSTPPLSQYSPFHVPITGERTLFQSSESRDNSTTSMSRAHPATYDTQELIEIALKEYEERTGINLLEFHLAVELKSCDSAYSVIEILQARSQESQILRDHGRNLMVWVRPVVYLLHALSTSGALGECVSVPLPPTIAIFVGIGVLLDETNHASVGASSGTLVDLFEFMENLLRPLDICIKIPPTTATTTMLMKILIELLSILALGAQQVQQGLLLAQYELGNKPFGVMGVEVVRPTLDWLNQEEASATAVQILGVVYGILENMKVVMNGGESSISEHREPVVGKIICDMIPDKLDIVAAAKPPSVLVNPDSVIVAAGPSAMPIAPIPSMLPPPSTPPTAVGIFPRVVGVNPTLHPTPPATPVPAGPHSPIPSSAQHLAPPPRLSAAVSRRHPPDATTPCNPVPSVSSPPQLLAPVPVAVVTQVATPQPQYQSQLIRLQSQPQSQSEPQPQRPVDDTLKPSDRRFFLQQDQSPSPEHDVQDRGSDGSISTGKSPSETGEVQPSSVTSNQTHASAASASSHPNGRGRPSRNAPTRPTMARLNSGRHVVQVTRKEPIKARTASLLTKAVKAAASKATGSSRQQRSPVEPLQPPWKAQHMNGMTVVTPKGVTSNSGGTSAGAGAGGAPRRGIVVSNSSSEYETTDTEEDDDDSWASEDISEGPAEAATMRPTDKRPPTKEETKLREAVVEAQRQRELFVKQPKRSYSNLGRTQSGLLSQLLNPDPTVFPPARPYRVSSTHDVTRPSIPSALTSSKSPAALPQAAQVNAQTPMGAATSSGRSNGNGNVNGSGGYRPKGRPQGEELEDESDSPDDPDDTIQVFRSLTQQRLAALANPAPRRASDNHVQPQPPGMELGGRPLLQTVATAPIPLNHPWNLPVPAPPTAPSTTRRQMLATELSESLRRNLLWERQVSNTNLLGNGGRRNGNMKGGGGGTGTGGMRTAATVNGNAQAGPSEQQQQQPQRQGNSAGPGDGTTGAVEDVSERRRRALARNRTWDDFHYFGW